MSKGTVYKSYKKAVVDSSSFLQQGFSKWATPGGAEKAPTEKVEHLLANRETAAMSFMTVHVSLLNPTVHYLYIIKGEVCFVENIFYNCGQILSLGEKESD